MNLTTYEGKKRKERIKNNYLTSNLKTTIFPSIFSIFATEKKKKADYLSEQGQKNRIFLPEYRNINIEMDNVKKQIHNLYNIKNSIFKQMITKKNSDTYRNFIMGFAKYFFGPFGLVTREYKYLKDYYFRTKSLNKRIFAGKLEYYNIMNHRSRFLQRQVNTKKKILSISKNYAVINDKNDLYSMKAITSNRFYNKNKNFISLNKQKHRASVNEITAALALLRHKYNSEKNTNNTKIYESGKIIKEEISKKSSEPLRTSINFYNKKKSLFSNYKKASSNIRNKSHKKIYITSNTEQTASNTSVKIKITNDKNRSKNKGIKSSLFLTQGSFIDNFNHNPNIKRKRITFNQTTNRKRIKKY